VGEQQILGGRYRLDEPLGAGGMSVVWRAFDLVLGRLVAVKVLSPRYAESDHFRESIRAEAQAAAKVSHLNLTSVYDYGESLDEAGQVVPFVVMELLTGPTLAERLAAGPLHPRTALRICAGIADGLALAHGHGLVHRDVKPGNIMLAPTGAKLVDFGVAAFAGAPEVNGPDAVIIGTPSYVAPERLLGGPVLPASDVYSLGVLLFRSLTGQLPWPPGMPTAQTRAQPPPLPNREGVPPAIGDLYLRCVDLVPDRRPTAREAATILAAAVGVRPVVADADDEDPPNRPASLGAAPVGFPVDADEVAPLGTSGSSRERRVAMVVAVVGVIAGILVVGNSNGSALRPPPRADDGAVTQAPSPTQTPPVPGAPPSQANGTPVAPPGQPITTNIWITGGGVPPPPVIQPGPGGATTPPRTTDPGPRPVPSVTRAFTSTGGTAVVTCNGSLAYLQSWSAADGYSVPRPPQVGPDSTVQITFRNRTSESTITAWCSGGEPEGQVTTGPGSNPPMPAPTTTRRR